MLVGRAGRWAQGLLELLRPHEEHGEGALSGRLLELLIFCARIISAPTLDLVLHCALFLCLEK